MSDLLDGCCSCHISPPCSYCVDTYECADCGARVEVAEQEEKAVNEEVCTDCLIERESDPAQDYDDIMDAVRASSGESK